MRLSVVAAAAALALTAHVARAEPPPLARHVCPNGLEVIVAERHTAPLVTVEIAVHTGAMTEPPEYSGLSHLYEHMFFKGNAVLPDQVAYMARLRELGLVFNGTTDNEKVNYYFTTTSDHFADAMTFMRDALVSPLFDAKELDRERVVVTGEIDRNESTPNYFLWHELQRHVFARYPTRKDPLGSRKTVLAATPAMMRTIKERYYVPNNSALVVVGDVSADDVFRRADAVYASWKRAPDPFVRFPLVVHPPIARSEVVVVEQPMQTFVGLMAWRGPQTSDALIDDTYAGDVLGKLVADPGSRFQRALVDSGKCVGAGLDYWTQRNAGLVFSRVESAEAKVDECVAAFRDELPRLATPDYFTDEELKNAAFRLEVDEANAREHDEGYAHLITSKWASSSLDYYRGYVDRVRAVTRADLARYLERWVLRSPFVLAAMVSPQLVKSGIDRKHFESLVGVETKGGQ